MGRAIVREPSVFLMDEPLSNLDAKLRVQMRAEVARVQRRIGVATIYVTHDQTEAMTLGHRVAVMRSGMLQQCDTPQVLYDRPANMFVAGFIGSPAMNLFEGTLADDRSAVVLGSQRLVLPAKDSSRIGRARAVPRIGPWSSVCAPRTWRSTGEVGRGRSSSVTWSWSRRWAPNSSFTSAPTPPHCARERTEGLEPAELNDELNVARVDPRVKVAVGDRVPFAIAPERIEFFDPDTGAAIRD